MNLRYPIHSLSCYMYSIVDEMCLRTAEVAGKATAITNPVQASTYGEAFR